MNLQDLGCMHGTDKALHHKYMDFYESNISNLRMEKFNFLEIGFFEGSSIKTWLDYFQNATIHCIDIIDIDFKHDRFVYHKISQEDSKLSNLFDDNYFTIIVDDGSHMTSHQLKSLELLWPKLKNGGLYLLEDLHTSFINFYIDSPVTTYNFLKNKRSVEEVDHIHDESESIEIYHRVVGLNTDSITSVIKKK